MKRLGIYRTLLCAILCVVCLMFGSTAVFATDIEQANKQLQQTYDNSVNSSSATSTTEQSSSVPDYGQGSVSDYLKGYTPVTKGNMNKASSLASPIVNFIGMLIGLVCVITTAGVGLITALDLLYIAIPPVRGFLYEGAQQGGMAGGMPGGMGMGNMRGGMGMGGMGMGGMQPQGGMHKIRWVSDEVVATVAMCQPQGQGGGMGMGMGMMAGGMGMQGAQQNMSTKSTISVYLKKRIFFLVLFAVASIVLLSTVFTDCGINVAALVMKIMAKVNGSIGGAL